MNASKITHKLNVIGGGKGMLAGVGVLMLLAAAGTWVVLHGDEALDGFFG